jgi:hypothetical protein
LPLMPLYVVHSIFSWSATQKNFMSIDCEHYILTVSFAMSIAVLLLQWTGMAGWACPNSCRTSQITLPSLQLRKRAASLASTADATTHLRMPQKVKMAPFSWMGLLGCRFEPRK